MWGANSDELLRIAGLLDEQSSRLESTQNALTGKLRSAPWQGPSADRYRGRWEGADRRQLKAAAGFLRSAAEELRRHAAEQAQASGAGGTGVGISVRAPNGATSPLAAGQRASASEYVEYMTGLQPGEIALRQVSVDPPRYVLMLRGLDVKSLDPAANNSWTSTLAEYMGIDSPYQVRIRELLASVPDDAAIAVIGHSQGGLAAMELAERDSRVQSLLIMGSPIDGKTMPPHVKNALFLEASRDPVPRLDSADPLDGNPNWAEQVIRSTPVVGDAIMWGMEQVAKKDEGLDPMGPGSAPKVLFDDPSASQVGFGPHHMGSYVRALQGLEDHDPSGSEVQYRGRIESAKSSLVLVDHYYGGGPDAKPVQVNSE